ncbi:MAG: ribonuclease III [Hyphomicrobiaceae bacterium]
MARARNARKEIETALGHTFQSRALLERALTHASVRAEKGAPEDNERLEFLGDRVLGLSIAELIIEEDGSASEGALARRYNRLVRKDACARVARDIGLGAALRLSSAEEENGGREKDTILADAMEAVLAAVFLESGYDGARAVVRALWGPYLAKMPETTVDPKSALQEWAQGRGLPLPRYVEISREGPDHAPRFKSEVRIGGCKPASGVGSNKRAAEQDAATVFLIREGVWQSPRGSGGNG